MAKDPAFLFYPGDWMGGTMTMTRHLKGCYIDLLIAQFNNGPLSLEQIKTLLGQDQASWTVLQEKFKRVVNSAGGEIFFNERLVTEIEKRKEFCNKQSERVKKRWAKSGIYRGNTVVIPKIENENRNENRNKGDRGVGKGEKFWTEEVKLFHNDFQWKEKFCREKNISMAYLEERMRSFITHLELGEDLKELKELKNHFLNWFNLKNSKNGSSKKTGQDQARADLIQEGERLYSELTAGRKEDP